MTPPRRRAAALALITIGVGAVLVPASGATAAEGPAPAPREHRVIAGVHTDAVSTFLDDGKLALASKADVDEGNGTRFAAGDIWFHLADDAKATVPAGYEFIAPAGTAVWIAPESNPGAGRLWPGFSTESVPAGAIEGNQTTFTLTGLDGPGSLELFTAAGFGGAKRLWSSSSSSGDLKSFPVGRTHMHANWAFTAAGTYRIGVEAAVTVGGTRQTARATYTFVVGGLPSAIATTTALTASATSVVAGDRVALDATVTPATAAGFVEFLDGDTVLGHTAVSGGRASLDTTALPLGSRSLTARFVPGVLNEFGRSTSAPVTVTVTERAGGDVFAITGLAGGYRAGDTIDLGFTGFTVGEGQQVRWLIRPAGFTTTYLATRGERYTRDATVALDGSDIKVQIRDAGAKVVQETAFVPLKVAGPNVGTGEPVTVSGMRDSYHMGDKVRVSVGHRALAGGERGRWVTRYVPSGVAWAEVTEYSRPKTDGPDTYLIDTSWLNSVEWAYEIVTADGAVVGRSPAVTAEMAQRELLLSGLRTVYRAGDTLSAASELYPPRDDVAYEWALAGDDFTPIPGATSATLEMPVTADLDGKSLYLSATDATTGFHIAGAQQELRVTDAAPGDQLLFLDSLSGHYHQGNTIKLKASADPAASDTDTYRWLWKRPDQADFTPIDKATTAAHELRAEQALDGTQVKAELFAATGELLATSEPSTIHVDDHGAAPQQKVTVESRQTGTEIVVTAAVAPASVLTRWEWYVQKPGEDTPHLVAGQHDGRLALPAAGLDGASVLARLTFDDGRTYVESAPVVLHVDGAGGPGDLALTVSGLSDGAYQPGDAVTLQAVQTPQGPLTRYQWFAGGAPVAGETGASYSFTATRALDGAEILVKLYDGDTVAATSAPVTLKVATPDPGSAAAKSVTATINGNDGALVISVAPEHRTVTLPAAALNAAGDRWEATGAMKPVTVTDTRSGRPGWSASGQVAGGFRTTDGTSFTGSYLGWTPAVVQQADQQGVVAGPVTAPDRSGAQGKGLDGSAVLATAPGQAGLGTAQLDAQLQLSVPTDTTSGTYTGTLTLTAI